MDEQRKRIMKLWEHYGGRVHGPNVETVTMPQDKFFLFMEDFRLRVKAQTNWDAIADEMGRDYTEKTIGKRPQI